MALFLAILLAYLEPAAAARDLDGATVAALHRARLPQITGAVLRIEGPLDSLTYDFLAYSGPQLRAVEIVELNSLGGDIHWALAVAEKLRALGVVTRVKPGDFCASACVVLFAAGRERELSEDGWLGIHGVRLSGGERARFNELCGARTDGADCARELPRWRELAAARTDELFSFLEAGGVGRELRRDYFARAEETDWAEHGNVLRTEDWTLGARAALGYGLATRLRVGLDK